MCDVGHQLVAIDVMADRLAGRDRGRLARDRALLEPSCGQDVSEDQDNGAERDQPTSSHPVSLSQRARQLAAATRGLLLAATLPNRLH